MKKLIVFVLILILLPCLPVQATPPCAEPGFVIEIWAMDGCNDTSDVINLDLLVKKEDVPTSINMTISPLYQDLYGETIRPDYLDQLDEDWTSYLAFVEGASYEALSPCYYAFALGEDEYLHYSSVMVVYFNDAGETLFTSEPLIMDQIDNDRGCRYGEITFNISTLTIENTYRYAVPPLSMLFMAVLSVLNPIANVYDFLGIPYSVGTLVLTFSFIILLIFVLFILAITLIMHRIFKKKRS